jgi:DNA anti-recombination protein RmuC
MSGAKSFLVRPRESGDPALPAAIGFPLTREFGSKIDRFVTQIDGRAETFGEKATNELVRLGNEANQGRDVMRRMIDERLLDATGKQAALARELREELGAGFQNLGRNTSSTLERSSDQQKERLDEVKKALERNIELQSKAHEALRLSVENRLDAIRLESSTKLEEVRSTLDEKLQVALEARLHQSFSRIVDQLAKVYEEIGEMKSLATAANGHFPVPAELAGPKDTFAP